MFSDETHTVAAALARRFHDVQINGVIGEFLKVQAQELLATDWNVAADVWSLAVTV